MDREYRYRKLFGLTHEQYLDEPSAVIEWMLRIHDIYPEEGGGGGADRSA